MSAHDDLFPGMYVRATRLFASARNDDERRLFQQEMCSRAPAFAMYYMRRAIHEGTPDEIEYAALMGRISIFPPK